MEMVNKMKLCIVTLYKTINSGSFLQAFALKEYLSSIGYEVYVLSYNYSLKTRFIDILKYPKTLVFDGYKNYKDYIHTNKKFKELQKKLNLIPYKKAEKNIDLFVFGSDTIWNIESRNLFKLRNILFGILFKEKRKISYAASFANTKYDDIVKHDDIINALRQFESISVRDNESAKIIDAICDCSADIVCDPTLLVEKKVYKRLINNTIDYKYIFIYLFDDLNSLTKNEIISFAQNNKMKIISGTKNYKWCDIKVSNSPDSFLTYMNNAEFIITDTFHGTIFSTIFNKNFITINRNKKKVNDYITKVNLENRLIQDGESINSLITNNIDYMEVNNLINNYKNKSIK